ncbi:hypothetical protein SEPCBS119000_004967 [Sporothrix epigloea]|uniref:Uncharacterized protein n=1 Tax=Sporothrix epigloea TaxID=1892477 RepID=A0ABP0DVB7_9PEZI
MMISTPMYLPQWPVEDEVALVLALVAIADVAALVVERSTVLLLASDDEALEVLEDLGGRLEKDDKCGTELEEADETGADILDASDEDWTGSEVDELDHNVLWLYEERGGVPEGVEMAEWDAFAEEALEKMPETELDALYGYVEYGEALLLAELCETKELLKEIGGNELVALKEYELLSFPMLPLKGTNDVGSVDSIVELDDDTGLVWELLAETEYVERGREVGEIWESDCETETAAEEVELIYDAEEYGSVREPEDCGAVDRGIDEVGADRLAFALLIMLEESVREDETPDKGILEEALERELEDTTELELLKG